MPSDLDTAISRFNEEENRLVGLMVEAARAKGDLAIVARLETTRRELRESKEHVSRLLAKAGDDAS